MVGGHDPSVSLFRTTCVFSAGPLVQMANYRHCSTAVYRVCGCLHTVRGPHGNTTGNYTSGEGHTHICTCIDTHRHRDTHKHTMTAGFSDRFSNCIARTWSLNWKSSGTIKAFGVCVCVCVPSCARPYVCMHMCKPPAITERPPIRRNPLPHQGFSEYGGYENATFHRTFHRASGFVIINILH